MQIAQVEADLARAHRAYHAGDLDGALRLAEALIAIAPDFAPARQLAAIVERRNGRLDQAQAHFIAALRAAPFDPHILNSYANLLSDRGEFDTALSYYQRALSVIPDHAQTWVNLAQTHVKLGARSKARQALERAVAIAQDHAPAWRALGVLMADDGDNDAAAPVLDTALRLDPGHLGAIRARGAVEAALGGDASPFYARARRLAPDDPDLALAEALALHNAGEISPAIASLEAQLAASPASGPVHAALTRIRWQSGAAQPFGSYEAVLSAQPGHASLWKDYLAALLRAGQPGEVLLRLERARPALGDNVLRFEAAAATEAGDIVRADAAFARLSGAGDPALQMSLLRHLLRAGRADAAAATAESFIAGDAGSPLWPYLATAWRVLGDVRWDWLEGNPALVQVFDLSLADAFLADLARVLRGLHRANAAPLDQSLRGGSQTEGDLFARHEPEILQLKATMQAALDEYLRRLPPPDANHPLLRWERSGARFAGAWSVRLSGAGFHVNHVHTEGGISSAAYIALPETLGSGDGDTAGWLTFGEPPAELGLSLRPFREVEPKRGRLVLFPSTFWHGTRPFPAGERLTVAFDALPFDTRRRGKSDF